MGDLMIPAISTSFVGPLTHVASPAQPPCPRQPEIGEIYGASRVGDGKPPT